MAGTVSIRPVLRRIRMWINQRRHGVRDVHPTTYLAMGSFVSRDLKMGPYGYIGTGAMICPKVIIGKYVMFGPQVTITGKDHLFDNACVPIIFSGRPPHPVTTIGDDVWVAAKATILAGVTIGNGAIVAAGAVITHDVEDYAIVAGVPGRKIADRFGPEDRSRHEMMLKEPAREREYCRPIE